MSEWMDEWQRRKTEVKPRNKKLVKKLASLNSKIVNETAEEIHTAVFNRIDCLDCANCCKSIPPIVNETDVRRISKTLGIKPAAFRESYLTFDDDNDMVINSSPCPFLAEDNTCSIYEVRPKACRQYPHTDNYEFTKHLQLHLRNANYCPAVFHILLEMEKSFR